MFAYCGNNPVCCSDHSGYTPWSDLGSWGEIHALVVEDIREKNNILDPGNPLESEVVCSTGRMDLFCPRTGEVWEVKSAGPASLIGMAQLFRYSCGTYGPDKQKITIGTKMFFGSISRNGFRINYWSVAPGLIVYDFAHEGYQEEIVTESAYEKQQNKRKSKVTAIAMAAVGSLGAGYAGAAIMSALAGPLSEFNRQYCFVQ